MKRLIYYPPGTYGTFINWICNTTAPITKDNLPFADFGNSHRYYEENKYAMLFSQKSRDILLRSSRDFGVLRGCWPCNVGAKLVNINQDTDFYYQTCSKDLQSIITYCDKILILHPNIKSRIWWYQNFCEKVTFSQSMLDNTFFSMSHSNDIKWLTTLDSVLRARHHLDLQKNQTGLSELFSQYKKTTAVDFDTWLLRTALVYDLNTQIPDAYQFWQQLEKEFDTVKFISLDQLRDNFRQTVIEILDFFEIEKNIVDDLSFIDTLEVKGDVKCRGSVSNKYANSLAYVTELLAGGTPSLYNLVNSYYTGYHGATPKFTLNSQPVSLQVDANPLLGTVSISATYDNKDRFLGLVSSDYSIEYTPTNTTFNYGFSCNNSLRHIAVDMNTLKREKVGINLVVGKPSTSEYTLLGNKDTLISAFKEYFIKPLLKPDHRSTLDTLQEESSALSISNSNLSATTSNSATTNKFGSTVSANSIFSFALDPSQAENRNAIKS